MFNKKQVKGAAKETEGKIQKEFGKAVDSPKHVVEGSLKETAGKAEKTLGDIEKKAKEKTREELRRAERSV